MAKTVEEKTRFIELRGRGLSYDKIAQEIEVGKSTLMKWSLDFETEIEQAQAIEFQSILEQYSIMRKSRVESFSSMLSACLVELKKRERNLENLSTEKLFSMVVQLENRLQEESKVRVEPSNVFDFKMYETVKVD